eukprot:6213494-Pleurochrysis_carterae.AAC.6
MGPIDAQPLPLPERTVLGRVGVAPAGVPAVSVAAGAAPAADNATAGAARGVWPGRGDIAWG